MSRVIGVLSGKGGVGKTTVVANLAAAFTNVFNKNILLFDSNISTSHLGLHLGIYQDLPVTLREVLKQRVPIMQAVHVHPSTGIRIVPAPLNGDGVTLTKNQCRKLVNQVKNNYDIVLLDCAPGLGKEVTTQISAMDEALIVTSPDLPSLTDAIKTAEVVKKLGKRITGIVVNRYRHEKYELTPKEISSTTNYDVIATIPEDRRIPESISKGVPAVLEFPHSYASGAFKNLAGSLIGVEYESGGLIERLRQLLSFGGFKRREERREIVNTQEQSIPVEAEVRDIQRLRTDLTKEVRNEMKRELMRKVKKKLAERGL